MPSTTTPGCARLWHRTGPVRRSEQPASGGHLRPHLPNGRQRPPRSTGPDGSGRAVAHLAVRRRAEHPDVRGSDRPAPRSVRIDRFRHTGSAATDRARKPGPTRLSRLVTIGEVTGANKADRIFPRRRSTVSKSSSSDSTRRCRRRRNQPGALEVRRRTMLAVTTEGRPASSNSSRGRWSSRPRSALTPRHTGLPRERLEERAPSSRPGTPSRRWP